MTLTIVNDYFFKPTGDVEEGKAAAAGLVAYFDQHVPEVQLFLWLESRDNPLHHYHITVFDNEDSVQRVKDSDAIRALPTVCIPISTMQRLFLPHAKCG